MSQYITEHCTASPEPNPAQVDVCTFFFFLLQRKPNPLSYQQQQQQLSIKELGQNIAITLGKNFMVKGMVKLDKIIDFRFLKSRLIQI